MKGRYLDRSSQPIITTVSETNGIELKSLKQVVKHKLQAFFFERHNPFADFQLVHRVMREESKKTSKEKMPSKREIPRRLKPVVQQQGHHVRGVQAEPKELGRQKLDNQEWRRCLHNSG